MKPALIALLLSASAWGQTATPAKAPAKAATKAAPAKAKAATPAKAKAEPAMDLMKPETIKGKAPGVFVVRLETTKGNIDIRVVRDWAPNGVERFYNLVRAGYYTNVYFFRALDFIVQAGISSKPALNSIWSERTLFDDRVVQSNLRGTVTFASSSAPNSRSVQFFINKTDANTYLDQLKFAPFGEVVEGMEVVDMIYIGYGQPAIQEELSEQGEAFINRNYPRMDKIIKASIIAVPVP
jgi:peptidyl-prolyl cis-trans isomerase A (cyclophilin A)